MHNDDIKPDANSHVDTAWDKDPLWYKDAIIYELHVKATIAAILFNRNPRIPRSALYTATHSSSELSICYNKNKYDYLPEWRDRCITTISSLTPTPT